MAEWTYVVQHLGWALWSEKSQDFGVRTIKLGERTSIGGDQRERFPWDTWLKGESERRQVAAGSTLAT